MKRIDFSRRAGQLAVPLFWALLCSIFFWDVLRGSADQIVGGNDLTYMFRIWLDYARSRVLEGALPLWNPTLYSGYSFISDPQPALFYPPTWLVLLMPATRTLGLLWVGHVWWMAVGATGWLRAEGASRWGALAGAAVFAFSGHTFARIQAGHIGVVTTVSWLPWALWALRVLAARSNRPGRVIALGAVSVGMSILAGHTATFVLVALLLAVYAIFLAWEKRAGWQYLLRSAGMGLLGVSLAAVQLLPLLQLLSGTSRLGGADYDFASRFSWPVGYLLTLLVPNFFGEPVRTGYWGEGVYDEMIFYVGVLALLLALLAGRLREGRFWAAVSGGALLLAFGSYGIVHRLFFRFVPLFATMRAPARAGVLFTCGVAALVALAITVLERLDEQERQRMLSTVNSRALGMVLGLAALVTVVCYMLYAWGRDSNPAAGRMWHLAGQVANFGFFFALAVAWLKAWLRPDWSRWLPGLATGLILLDLWTLGAGLVRMVPAPQSGFWQVVAAHTDPAEGRVLPWGINIFDQNGGMPLGIQSVFGYNPLEDEQYNRFVSAVPDPRARAYDLLNVAYVVSQSPLELAPDDSLSLTYQGEGVFIYARSSQMPRTWQVSQLEIVPAAGMVERINQPSFDPQQTALVAAGTSCPTAAGQVPGEVTIVSDTGNTILARTFGNGGMVVFSERMAAGWQASLDGEPVELVPVDHVLRGVCVPAGDHTIQMDYRPVALVAGGVVTGLSGLVLVALSLLRRRQGG